MAGFTRHLWLRETAFNGRRKLLFFYWLHQWRGCKNGLLVHMMAESEAELDLQNMFRNAGDEIFSICSVTNMLHQWWRWSGASERSVMKIRTRSPDGGGPKDRELESHKNETSRAWSKQLNLKKAYTMTEAKSTERVPYWEAFRLDRTWKPSPPRVTRTKSACFGPQVNSKLHPLLKFSCQRLSLPVFKMVCNNKVFCTYSNTQCAVSLSL